MNPSLKAALITAISLGVTVCYGDTATANRSITLYNNTNNQSLTVYMGFNGQTFGCYPKSYFSTFCRFNSPNPYICQLTVTKAAPVVVKFNQACQISVAFTSDREPWGACPTSLAEFTLNGNVGGKTQDTLDVSFVNGINKKINVASTSAGSLINLTSAINPYNTIKGVYPPGCDGCALSINPPKWVNCPGMQPKANCQAGTQFSPVPGCQITRPPMSSTDSYNVVFSEK